ncbi:MAG: CBS domain-containing protein [Nitriliruptorales bacterium]|nr:CBS domain-containing protein [Nitriliruptorales bacterium]
MTTAADIMTPDPMCVYGTETVYDVSRRMAQLGVGAMPICTDDDQVIGMITDRDVVVKVIAEQRDPRSVQAGELAQAHVVTVDVDDDAEHLLRFMTEHQVRRLPVTVDGRLVGIVAQADVAQHLPLADVGDLVGALSVD